MSLLLITYMSSTLFLVPSSFVLLKNILFIESIFPSFVLHYVHLFSRFSLLFNKYFLCHADISPQGMVKNSLNSNHSSFFIHSVSHSSASFSSFSSLCYTIFFFFAFALVFFPISIFCVTFFVRKY